MGAIRGLVTDPTDAVVPGARILVKNQGIGTELALVSSEAGLYRAVSRPAV